MELSDAIIGRRTVRKFKDDEVPSRDLEHISEAARWAPSWANTQCWEVVVVKDEDRKRMLAETLSQSNPARGAMIRAPIVLAVQNMCLMAHSLGLGTVIVGLFDANRAEEVLKISEDRSVTVFVPVGFAEKGSHAPNGKEISEFVRYGTY